MGDSVNISIEALNTNVSGKVIGISPIADTVGGDVVYKVTVELDEQPKGLLWGMTAEVTIGE
jgi:HlyD family secretion protein